MRTESPHVPVLTFLFRLFSLTQGNPISFQLHWLPIFALTVLEIGYGFRLNWSQSQLHHSFAFGAISASQNSTLHLQGPVPMLPHS